MLLVFLLTMGISSGFGQWVQTSGPEGGWLRSLAVNNGKIYAGTMAGVFVSTNNGLNWSDKSNGLPNLCQVRCIGFDSSRVFIGTGSETFQSTNEGDSWFKSDSGLKHGVTDFKKVGPRIFASTGTDGIYCSDDHGMYWNHLDSAILTNIASIAVIDSNIFAGGLGGVVRSTNNGVSWTQVNNGLNNMLMASTLVAFDKNIIVGGSNGVFFSTNYGESWILTGTGLPATPARNMVVHDNHLYASFSDWTGGGVYRLSNFGGSWDPKTNEVYNRFVNALLSVGSKLFMGTYNGGGVYVSTDSGENWSSTNSGMVNTLVSSLAVSGNTIFSGVNDYRFGTGLYRSTNNGTSWIPSNHGIAHNSINVIAALDSIVIAGTDGGAFISRNLGASWDTVDVTWFNRNFQAISLLGSNIFLGGIFQGVLLSMDGGKNWNPVNSGLTNLNILSLDGNDSTLIAGTDAGAYVSTNMGSSWNKIASGLPNGYVNAIVHNDSFFFAGVQGSPWNGVYRSVDNGLNWIEIVNGLQNKDVKSLFASNNQLFAGTFAGVYVSINNGTSWTKVTSGRTDEVITDIVAFQNNLFIGVQSYGVWRRPLSEMITGLANDRALTPKQYFVEQNYPNPFNPSTKISYSLPSNSNIRIIVFNVLGQQIEELVNQQQSVGRHETVWNAGVGSGVYYYRIEATDINNPQRRFSETKKMLLLR